MSLLSRFGLFSSIVVSLAACGGSQPEASAPSSSSSTSSSTASNAPAAEEPLTDPPTPPKATGNPFKGMKLWVDPDSLSMLTANSLRKKEPEKAKILDKIAQQPQALWVGDWNKDVKRYMEYILGKTKADGAVP